MARRTRSLSFAVSSIAALLTLAGGEPGLAASPAGCSPDWQVVSSPNVNLAANLLTAVSASSSTDAWAVGWNADRGGVQRSVAEHWNGAKWSTVPTPVIGAAADDLFGVTSGAAQGTWAVGTTRDDWATAGVIDPLILLWDGSAWQVSPPALLPVKQNQLQGVAGLAADDVWAVGEAGNGSQGQPRRALVEHWDGVAWSIVPTPTLGSSHGLSGVTEVSPTDVWAAGWRQRDNHVATLVEHWDGATWSVVPTPERPGQDISMRAIAAASATELWMAGSAAPIDQPAGYRPLNERWDGVAWSAMIPPRPPRRSYFLGLATMAPGDAVAVGSGTSEAFGPEMTLIERLTGGVWSIEPSPSPSSSYNVLYGAAGAQGVTWAVGGYEDTHGKLRTLVEESCKT